jgi:hypothetical protein
LTENRSADADHDTNVGNSDNRAENKTNPEDSAEVGPT